MKTLIAGYVYLLGFFFTLGYARGHDEAMVTRPSWREACQAAVFWPMLVAWMLLRDLGGFVMPTLLILGLGAPADAAYFRLLRPLDEVKTGAFLKLGTPHDAMSYGFQTTLVKHQAADGFLFMPGVSWSLLDVGGAKTEAGAFTAVVGPSVDLSEPVKTVLLAGVRRLFPEGMGAVKALLAPAQDGKACLAASVGPGMAFDLGDLSDVHRVKGAAVVHFGLAAKW